MMLRSSACIKVCVFVGHNGPQFFDAHHHLWDLSAMRHTWLAERGVTRFFGNPAPIQKNYHIPDFKTDHGAITVSASVHIQCGVAIEHSIRETLWVEAQAEQYGMVKAIVAFCDLTTTNAQDQLDQHRASSRLRGVRQIVGRDAAEDAKNGTNALLENAEFEAGLRTLIDRNLSFDLQLTPPLLPAAAKLFGKVEALPVALCHAGSPQDFSKEAIKSWEAGLKTFAELPNAICKVSGLGMFDQNWTVDSFRERVLRAIDIFGPRRIAFGSNFPVDRLYATYEKTIGAFVTLTEDFTPADRSAMFQKVAAEFYRVSI